MPSMYVLTESQSISCLHSNREKQGRQKAKGTVCCAHVDTARALAELGATAGAGGKVQRDLPGAPMRPALE